MLHLDLKPALHTRIDTWLGKALALPWVAQIISRFVKRRPPVLDHQPAPEPAPAFSEPMPVTAEPSAPESEPRYANRHERRVLERRRRRHDKFVVPQGALPKQPKPQTQEIEPKPKPKPQDVADPEVARTEELLIFQVDAMLLAMGAGLVQKFAKAEGEAVEWDRCLLAVSHMVKEMALAMKPDQRGERP